LELSSEIKKKEMEELREGWDLVLDIDCKFFEYSKICTELIIRFLRYCGVKDVSCKFSGNKGFHIGVPFEAFPKRIKDMETRSLFPEAPKKIAFYIKENIKEELSKRVLKFEEGDFRKIKEKTGFDKEIIRYEENEFGDKVAKLNVEPFLEIDTILISPRHLYRMPYSLHEKSGLASVMIEPDKVMLFEKEMAKPENVKINSLKFLDREVEVESGARLLLQALDFKIKKEEKDYDKKEFKGERIKIEGAIKEEFFPPCVKKILEGLEDGRKRAVFCLINFLGKIGWEKKEIQRFLLKWNRENNKESLRENLIISQLNYFKGDKLPPNCDNEAYYKDLGVCQPDGLCKKIKNPVNYAILRWKWSLKEKKEKEKKGNK
jgi:DNA primase catalytic subunit